MKHTKTEEISAANARISAQETVLGQALSTAVLIRFTTSKPLIELLFGKAPCSLTIVVVSFNKIEASQPFHKHKHIDIKFMSYKYPKLSKTLC
jgi:hypothetical protein